MTGKPEPTVKWFCDGKEIKATFKCKMTKTKEVCTLAITGVTIKQTGVYKCVANNKAGEAIHEAKITVSEKMEPPVFTLKPTNKDVFEGIPVKFEAKAKGIPIPETTWYKGEEPIEATDAIKIDSKTTKTERVTSLAYDGCTVEDKCEIRCVANNPAGEATCSAKLDVKSKQW